MSGDDENDPLIGTKLGPCRIEKRLAAGGMGVVYRARHTILNEDVAVKVLAPMLAQDQEYVTRFFREAGAAGGIDHPNVVRVIDVGRSEDRYFLVMEFVEGDTLDRVIEVERRLSLERATKYLRDIAAGLAAAHRSGTIHRDIKPGNIIISPDGVCHLTDFGLARQTSPNTRKGLTVEGTFLGTPEYASPEQVEGKKLDHRTDLYSLGVTYYHMISGTLPFMGESAMEIAIKRAKEDPRPLESAFPGADPRACAIVRKLLQREPVQRYQSATDLIRDLEAILQGPKPGVRVSETTKKVANVLKTARVRRRWMMLGHWAVMLAAVFLACLGGGLGGREGAGVEEAVRGARVGLLASALVLALASQAFYFKDLGTWGIRIAVAGLDLLMVGGAVLAGAWIGSAPGGAGEKLAAFSGELASKVLDPANRLGLAAAAMIGSVQLAFEREPGTHRIWISRTLMLLSFALAYLFGLGEADPLLPFRRAPAALEIALPVGTGAFFMALFGLVMATAYDIDGAWRWLGVLVSVLGASGIMTFALLLSKAEGPGDPWGVLAAPFQALPGQFRGSGTLLVGVILVGVAERALSFWGMKRQERSNPRRRF